ncbi:17408_t:CDS:2, partial [Cetraspora pellucida]
VGRRSPLPSCQNPPLINHSEPFNRYIDPTDPGDDDPTLYIVVSLVTNCVILTQARHWSFNRFYSFTIQSGDAPKAFNEIYDKWIASLKFIKKSNNIPKSIMNFVGELIEFSESKELENLRVAYEQNFQAHLLATISSGRRDKKDEEVEEGEEVEEEEPYVHISQNFDSIPDFNQVNSDDESTEETITCKNNLKRKLVDDELPGYDGLVFLFNDSNEDKIIEKIDENTLEEERKLPLASDNKDQSISICDEILNKFQKYQNKIPKICIVYTIDVNSSYEYRKEIYVLSSSDACNEKLDPFKKA